MVVVGARKEENKLDSAGLNAKEVVDVKSSDFKRRIKSGGSMMVGMLR